MSALHTLSVLVEDRPGVLARVAGLFAARGFNIHSLAVGTTEEAGLSRMTVVVDVEGENIAFRSIEGIEPPSVELAGSGSEG